LLGYLDQALKKSQEALAVAQEVVHPLSLGGCRGNETRVSRW
jgi:hypothetical protein